MIFASQEAIKKLLLKASKLDQQPLVEYAGFSKKSEFYGQARGTFSIILSTQDYKTIKQAATRLHNMLISDTKKYWLGNPVPYDFIRFDAFYDQVTQKISILELNTKNVGMHEFVDWLDEQLAPGQNSLRLNQRIAKNQYSLHKHRLGEFSNLFYVSSKKIPRWLYLDALKNEYYGVKIIDLNDYKDFDYDTLSYKNLPARAITHKLGPVYPTVFRQLDSQNKIVCMQPIFMRPFGSKHYLETLDNKDILHSEAFNTDYIDQYMIKKDDYVLKQHDTGGSNGITLGVSCDDTTWQDLINMASKDPAQWVMQQFCNPPYIDIWSHSMQNKIPARVQLGVFIVPQAGTNDLHIDIVAKAYVGKSKYFLFDPSGENQDIWFGNVIVTD